MKRSFSLPPNALFFLLYYYFTASLPTRFNLSQVFKMNDSDLIEDNLARTGRTEAASAKQAETDKQQHGSSGFIRKLIINK